MFVHCHLSCIICTGMADPLLCPQGSCSSSPSLRRPSWPGTPWMKKALVQGVTVAVLPSSVRSTSTASLVEVPGHKEISTFHSLLSYIFQISHNWVFTGLLSRLIKCRKTKLLRHTQRKISHILFTLLHTFRSPIQQHAIVELQKRGKRQRHGCTQQCSVSNYIPSACPGGGGCDREGVLVCILQGQFTELHISGLWDREEASILGV